MSSTDDTCGVGIFKSSIFDIALPLHKSILDPMTSTGFVLNEASALNDSPLGKSFAKILRTTVTAVVCFHAEKSI